MNTVKSHTKKRGGKSAEIDASLMVYGKVPPFSRPAEEAVLGAMMLEVECVPEVLQHLSPEMFYFLENQVFFEAIRNLSQRGIKQTDMISVLEEIKRLGKAEDDTAYKITKLTQNVVSSANVGHHAWLIVESWKKREAIRIGSELIQKGYDETEEAEVIYTALSNDIVKVAECGSSTDAGDLTGTAVEMIQSLEQEPGQLLGADTGLMMLNDQISGLVPPDLIIIAARPGQGKTAVAKQLAYNLSIVQGIPGDYYSLEMSKEQLMYLLWSCDTGVPHDRIKKKILTPEEKERLYKSMAKIGSSPLKIDDSPALNIHQLRAKAHIAKRKRNIQYIIVDYLQLMSATNPNTNREQQISEISRGLKILAKELKMPVIALSQLSRECEKRPDKKPQLSDLRESGAIEQDADIVIFLMRPEYYGFTDHIEVQGRDYHPSGLLVVIIAKNRHNTPGTFALMANLSISRVLDHGFEC